MTTRGSERDAPPRASGPILDRKLIDEARAVVSSRLLRTPLEDSPALAERLGVPVRLKLEHLQVTGSFKARGALFRLSRLDAAERAAGVVTCSAGNHGLAVAWAARELGVTATVYVPRGADRAKVDGIRAQGGKVVESPHPGYDDTEAWARRQEAGAARVWVSPFDDYAVMAANGGTLAAEILEDAPDTAAIVVPVGGGGLAAGLAVYLEGHGGAIPVLPCQHRDSPGLARSLAAGRAITRLPAIETAAGGVEGGIGALCFPVLEPRIDRVALVSEEEILAAVRWTLATHRTLIEPSAAVAVAACLGGRVAPLPGPTVVVLTGRNVAFETLARIVAGRGPVPGAAG